jgi:hypothetical protein
MLNAPKTSSKLINKNEFSHFSYNNNLPKKTIKITIEPINIDETIKINKTINSDETVVIEDLVNVGNAGNAVNSDPVKINVHPTGSVEITQTPQTPPPPQTMSMHQKTKVCIFDTETFTDKKIPIQIAWDIYEISNQSMNIIQSRMYYITEVWVLSKRRNDLEVSQYFTQNTLKKHEIHLQNTGFPLKTAKETLEIFINDLQTCDYIAAFNIEWDITAIQNMIKEFNLNCLNPIIEHKKLDIMYMVYEAFSKQLIESGINDNIINQMGIKYDSEKKGVCTAEYMIQKLLNNNSISQVHLADHDVKLEKQLMELCLKKKGTILYTKSDLPIYKKIQDKAKKMYPDVVFCKQKNAFRHQHTKCLSCNESIKYGETVYRTRENDFHCEFCYETQIR